ncbi:MAG: restriction endonuclease, partial [Pseudomonadota bacterium]
MKDLSKVDLVIDETYGGSRIGNASDDPLPKLLGVDSGGGFRHLGKRPKTETLKLLVIKSNFNDQEWPDRLNRETGVLTYYGDNKKVANIHDTPRQGNLILKNLFQDAADRSVNADFPPILVFRGTGQYRDVQFLGLAVPGVEFNTISEDLVAIWRTKRNEERFQNYRADFTILDVPTISRYWINDIADGKARSSKYAPSPWISWLKNRTYDALQSPKTSEIRSRTEQMPSSRADVMILKSVTDFFENDPFAFEECALEISRLHLPSITTAALTPNRKDGGRDAIGTLDIGSDQSKVSVEFALEAKCYSISNGVGVRDLSRIISRIRHRQLGILVTTSYLGQQAYQELKEDQHPIIVICGIDIVN